MGLDKWQSLINNSKPVNNSIKHEVLWRTVSDRSVIELHSLKPDKTGPEQTPDFAILLSMLILPKENQTVGVYYIANPVWSGF